MREIRLVDMDVKKYAETLKQYGVSIRDMGDYPLDEVSDLLKGDVGLVEDGEVRYFALDLESGRLYELPENYKTNEPTMLLTNVPIVKEHITLDNLPKGSITIPEIIPDNVDDFIFDKDNDGFYVNTIYELWFDVDSVFNTNTKEKDDTYIDFYTNYYPETKNLEAYFIECSDYDNEHYEYPLTDGEKQLLMDLLNERARVYGYESIDDMCKAYIEEDKLEETEEELCDLM